MRIFHAKSLTAVAWVVGTSSLSLLACGGGSDAPTGSVDTGPGVDPSGDAKPPIDGSTRDAGATADAASEPAAPPPIPCDAQQACSDAGASTCCNGFCVDTSRDPANCGQCGRACASGQFCDGTQCDDAILSNVCANPRGTVSLDSYDGDNAAGVSLGKTLTTNCTPAPTIVELSQASEGVVDPSTGRPVTGVGNTFIAGGGGFGQNGIAYIELQAPISPVYLHNDGTTSKIIVRATGASAVETMDSDLTAQHDFFYVQLAVEPQSGTLCFSAVGILAPGTQAAGYYVSAVIGPNLSTYTQRWYVFEWTDANGDSVANAGDTFTMIASGS